MEFIWRIAERRIIEAMEKGEFDNLPGAGKPLAFDDDSFVPDDLKMAFRILKNAGVVPPEVAARKEIGSLKEMIAGMDDEAERLAALKRLDFLRLKLAMLRPGRGESALCDDYRERVAGQMVRNRENRK